MSTFKDNWRAMPLLHKIAIVISLLLLIISFFPAAFYLTNPGGTEARHDQIGLFFLGWLVFLTGEIKILLIWAANPLYIISILMMIKGKKTSPFVLSALAGMMAASFMLVSGLVATESGQRSEISSYGYGYKLWLAAILIIALANLLTTVQRLQREENEKEAARKRAK